MLTFALSISKIRTDTMKTNNRLFILLLIAVLTIIPFLCLTEFNSKGEPREAVVALSMLKEGNWILPVNNGGDIPYKPPFFHWLIALFSLVSGRVTEFTSRLPSALALIAMTAGVYTFYRKRRDERTAFVTALLTLTAFEVHRAGMNCRVDMVLTALIVGALLLLYRWFERGSKGVPLWAVLCMSGAACTKGPVGILLPCLVMGIFMLMRGARFWRTFFQMFLFGLLACILPALWYVAAWRQGGDNFLSMVYDENFGRFTGSMSYDSHVHPFTYNFVTVISGWLPWTLLMLLGALVAPRRKLGGLLKRFKELDSVELFTWLAFLIIFVFYCIPKSKRSVYLLPIYPFMAWLMAEYIIYLVKVHVKIVKGYAGFIATLGIVLTLLLFAVGVNLLPDSMFHGKHAADNIAMMQALAGFRNCWWQVILALLPVAAGLSIWHFLFQKEGKWTSSHLTQYLFICVFSIFIALDGVILPRVLSVKSDKMLAERLVQRYYGTPIYSYMSIDMMHFFCTNFYAEDCIGQFEQGRHNGHASNGENNIHTPISGVVMIPAHDCQQFLDRYKAKYNFTLDMKTDNKCGDAHDTVYIYRFKHKKFNQLIKQH